ncbi:hypothetical protein ACFV14_10875 [Streptomyces zaomyceticus]|uniref:hypothetical protein n=1 Tax=Streptomyces zaomyceticus TaxID=68286 RepID=UPI00368E8217
MRVELDEASLGATRIAISPLRNAAYAAGGVPARERKRRIAELPGAVGLLGRAGERVEGSSRGMRQRLRIAPGPVHRPDVLFPDEPSAGVDPVAARDPRRRGNARAPAMFRFLGTARLVVGGGAISCRAASTWTTPPMFLGTPLVGPLFQVLFRVVPGGEPVVADGRFPLVGNAVPGASASGGCGGTTPVDDERRCGTRPPSSSVCRCPQRHWPGPVPCCSSWPVPARRSGSPSVRSGSASVTCSW